MANSSQNTLLTLQIKRLGGMADGIAEHDGKPVFVPFTCAGDEVKAMITQETKDHLRGDLVKVITPSAQRQTPECAHFGQCGGCSLQHIDAPTYKAFKQEMLATFLQGIGVDRSVVAPVVEVKRHARRRVEFKVSLKDDQVLIGFSAPKSHKMIEVRECPVSDPAFVALLPDIKACLSSIKKPGRVKSISLTVLEHGLDAVVHLSSALGVSDLGKLCEFAQASPIVRMSTQIKAKHPSRRQSTIEAPICIYDEANATIDFSGIPVALPAGAFLQATQAGQDAITKHVVEHLKGCNHVADLYSGCGTYSFALIAQCERVSAYEGVEEMAGAMNDACVRAELDEKMATTMRDLFSEPLSTSELNHFDGLVINPPRNGALPQVEEIAQSNVGVVVMVSCSPATFKRDAKCLLDAGYQLTLAVPIDQFYWSRHLELVAVFKR